LLLIIDNYDSFVFNLARYFQKLGQETVVVRNDAVDVTAIRTLKPQGIVLSPGPCTPNEAGCSLEVVRELHGELPLLGVCLGHQSLAAALGGEVIRAAEPMHGRTSQIEHAGQGVFAHLPSPLTVCRYHSLVVREASLPESLQVTARNTTDGTIMALAHREYPTIGLQFHPESILTEGGYQLLANWLQLAGLPVPQTLPTILGERPPATATVDPRNGPEVPVTF
jgi:anthranilate synthase/aminodeoxychorismate synthase-like glutamine amidotransferase